MLAGRIWLDYDSEDEEAHWGAGVTDAVLRDDEIVVEFCGHAPDQGKFSGSFTARKIGSRYAGAASFTVQGRTTVASVSLTLISEGGSVSLAGMWHDSGDRGAYALTAELERS